MKDFSGLVGVVTGGASGIGMATAGVLRDRGADVAVLDVVDGGPDGVLSIVADVTDDEQVNSAFQRAADAFGRVDILVNNAGIGSSGTVDENDLDEWMNVFDVNVYGVVRATRAALPFLRKSPNGVIVNTCSIAAVLGLPDRALYAASKGALYALTLAMAADLLADGIRVNSVLPGTVATPWVDRLLDKAGAERRVLEQALRTRQPHGRLVTPGEVAEAIAYLASPASGSTSGIGLRIDGGMAGVRLPERIER